MSVTSVAASTSGAPLLAGGGSNNLPARRFWVRFSQHHLALISVGIVLVWILVAVFAEKVAPWGPATIDARAPRAAPSLQHWLGTDLIGRDVLSRVIYGARTSLLVVVGAVFFYVVIGTVVGALAGYFGGVVDGIITWLLDVFLSFPTILIVLTFAGIVGPSLLNVILILGLFQWPEVARYVRAEYLSLRRREYVMAALAIGSTPSSVMFKHILPNALSPIIVLGTFGAASFILAEAVLSFLGWGVPPPTASWGQMIADAQNMTVLSSLPWLWLPPGLSIAVSVLAINFLGEGLRDALDARPAGS
jgi:peptide/nickel transport system permease protein